MVHLFLFTVSRMFSLSVLWLGLPKQSKVPALAHLVRLAAAIVTARQHNDSDVGVILFECWLIFCLFSVRTFVVFHEICEADAARLLLSKLLILLERRQTILVTDNFEVNLQFPLGELIS